MKIKNIIPKSIIDAIPSTIVERRAYLNLHLKKHIKTSVFCPSLQAYVYISKDSIEETIYNAVLEKSSMIMALNIKSIIEFAEIKDLDKEPESNKQKKDFKFSKVNILTTEVENVGVAKLVIGYILLKNKKKFYIEYSITDIEFSKK
ncbi:MAG: hypothetical protein K5860_06520 [Bacteroidales bacterium]|nr:hypothetical protein [Bacteroidales bacterium]